MPFGFLGKGLSLLGKGIKSGVGKLGEMGEMGGDGAASGGMFPQPKVLNPKLPRPNVPMTPGINPNAPMPDLGGGKGGMFGKGIDLINRQQPQPNAMPGLRRPSPIPTTGNPLRDIEAIERFQSQPSSSDVIGDMERLSNQVNANNREGRQGLLPMPETQTQLIPERAIPKVAIPRLPGEERPDVDPRDNPVMAARYDYMRKQAKAPSTMREYSVNEDGSLGDATTRDIPGTGGYRRSIKNVFQNALLGAAQGMQTTGGELGGALGGALAGGAGTAINPQAGREFTFDNFYRPRIERDLAETQRNQDRQRKTAFEDDERLQRKTDAEMKRREAEKRIENYDVDNRARAQEIQMRQDEMDYRRQNPPKLRRPTFRDEGGFMRYEDSGEYLLDPQTKQPIRGYDRPATENDRPIPVSPGTSLVDKTGREIYKNPPRSGAMSRDAQKAIREVNGLKQQAMQLWEQSKRATDPTQKAQLEEKARMAQYTFNEAALGLAEVYPEDFEAGEGEGGWNYAKPIGSTPQIQRRPQAPIVSRAAVEGFAQEKRISYDEALKRFRAKGITVQ